MMNTSRKVTNLSSILPTKIMSQWADPWVPLSFYCVYTRITRVVAVSILKVSTLVSGFKILRFVYSMNSHRFSANGRPKQREKSSFLVENILVYTLLRNFHLQEFCITLLCLSRSYMYSHTLSTGRHFEPAQYLFKRYCHTSWHIYMYLKLC